MANGQRNQEAVAFVSSMRDYWGTYHHHKETTGFGVATVYLGAVATAIASKETVARMPAWLLIVTAIAVIAFVWWQLLGHRLFAANMVAACVTLQSEWLSPEPNLEGIDEVRETRGYKIPRVLWDRFVRIREARPLWDQAYVAPFLTLALMVLWTCMAGHTLW